ncbi:MAG: hypothetical protein GY842_15970 [bacterium]|nr:hypothetical protein [bacterium]
MKWLVRSFIFAAVGVCVTTAFVIPALREQLESFSFLPRGAQASGEASGADASAAASTEMVAAMHAKNQADLEATVLQIRGEFQVEVQPSQFSSHHVARDYLERLRISREAHALGFSVDPDAFGDDAFMRRYVEALRQGGQPAATALLREADVSRSPAGGRPVRKRDCVFLYGQKYFRDALGNYVRDDGGLLQTSDLQPARKGRMLSRSADQPETGEPAMSMDNLPQEVDQLLEMLKPAQAQ